MTQASFEASKTQFSAHGEPTTDVSGIGDAAHSSSIGTGTYAINTLVVLKGSNEILITGPATLTQIETLVNQTLTNL